MADWLQSVEPLTLKGQIRMPYTWSVGITGSRFLTALRDHKKILANRCGRCGTVYVPPRKNCGKCFVEISEDSWTEVSGEGTVSAFSIVRYDHPIHPAKAPFAYAVIDLEGAGVGFMHIIKGDLDKLKPGVRVRACFREDRNGTILDIDSFAVV